MNRKKRLAVFDIDGTIFRKNLHFELINELVWFKVFPNQVRHHLTEIYTDWLEHEGTYESYRRALIGLYAKHITGCSEKDVLKAAKMVIPFHARRTYIFAEKLIKKLREDGYYLMAISGSPIEIVREYNLQYLKFDEVFGSVYDLDENKRYTGVSSFEPVKNKGEVMKQYAYEHGLLLDDSYGVGDTESDASLLYLVDNPIAFNPNQNLKSIAEKEKWRIVVEKKDVVYEIQ